MKKTLVFLAAGVALLCSATGQTPSTEPLLYPNLSAEDNARLAWWVDARYGMFLHWGVASIKGVELSWRRGGSKPLDIGGNPAGYVEDPVYDNLYKTWNPDKFDARQWVRIAKAAGMQYMVLTVKHHDGFCLWDTKFTEYKITSTPFKRDVFREFTDACHEAGMRVGVYYSQRDWHNPDYGIGDNRKYVDYMNGQLGELLTNYGPIDIIWFDSYGKGDLKEFWRVDETWQLLKKLAPKAVINNRLTILGKYNIPGNPYIGDFDTPEQTIGKMQNNRAWESCMCFVGNQWGYKPGGEMYSLASLLRGLVSCATGDGNLLLNIGPMPTGEIEPRQAERLKEGGDWLAKYGRTIYGTRGGPWQNSLWGGSTRKGNSVFLHVFNWKDSNTLRLLPLPQKVMEANVLTGGTVKVVQSEKGLDITVPPENHDPIDTIVELKLDAPATALIRGEPLRSMFDTGEYGTPLGAKASVAAYPAPPEAAAGSLQCLVTTGNRTPVSTDVSSNPAITLDLGDVHNVKGIRVEPVNGRDPNLRSLIVRVSADGTNWTDVWKCADTDVVFEFPVTSTVAGAQVPGVAARFVRLQMQPAKPAKLGLRQVQVVGE